MTYPTFEEISTGSNPDKMFVTKRSLQSILPRILLFILSSVLVAYLNIAFGTDTNANKLRWFSLIPIVLLLEIVRVYYNDLYILAQYKVIRHQGRISFQYTVPSINYNDIRGIIVAQSFFGRIFNYGDVFLGTAAYDGHELVLEGVEDPYQLAELIEKFRKQNQEGSSNE